MTLSANRDVNRFVDQELRSYPVAASAHIYKGVFVGVERTTGQVRPLQAGDLFVGIAYEEVDNTSGTGGDVAVRAYTQGDFILPTTFAAQPSLGAAIYATDDETATAQPAAGGSFIGVLMSMVGANEGIVRILPVGAQQDELTVTTALAGSTTAAKTHAVLIPQRPIVVISVQVSFLTVPDQGNLDVGTTLADPDEVVNAFDLSTLTANIPATPLLAGRNVAAGVPLLAKVGQASTTAADGGMLSIRYIELP